MRRLFETHGEFEAAVRIAERQLFLTEDPAIKIARECRTYLGENGIGVRQLVSGESLTGVSAFRWTGTQMVRTILSALESE